MIRNIYVKKLLIILVLSIVAFCICMQSPLDIFSYTGEAGTDSSVYKYIGWMMSEGYVPYRDYFEHKGFLLYFINYVGILISYDYGIWFIELVFMFITVTLVYMIARKFVNQVRSIFIVLLSSIPLYEYLQGGNLSEEYALAFELAALYVFIDFFIYPQKYTDTQKGVGCSKNNLAQILLCSGNSVFDLRVAICGLCFAAVFFIRANMTALWVVFCPMVFIQCIRMRKSCKLINFMISFIIGILVISLPTLVYLGCNDALGDFFHDYWSFSRLYITDDVRASLINKIDSFFTFFNTIWVLLAFVIMGSVIGNKIAKKQSTFFEVGYVFYMVVNLIFICLSGQHFKHYGMTVIPMLIYPYCMMYKHLVSKAGNDAKSEILITGYLLINCVIPSWSNICQSVAEDVLVEDSIYTNEAIEYIKEHTTEEDTISVYGNKDIIYNLSRRRSASKYSYQAPIGTVVDASIMYEYFEDLERTLPKVIVWQKDRIKGTIWAEKMNDFLQDNHYILVIDDSLALYEYDVNE